MRFTLLLAALLCPLSLFAVTKDTAVSLSTPNGTIYGTLTLPPAKGPVPLAIVIAGSGPTDRNGNQNNMINNSLLALGDSLAREGIASLRYDKRGVKASKAAAANETKLRFDDYITDAVNWIKKYRHDKRFSGIYLIGHSEGSLIGMVAAQKAPVSGFVSIAGAAQPADTIIIRQIKALAPDSSLMPDSVRMLFQALRKYGSVDSVPPGIYQAFMRKSVQPYLLSWIRYNPSAEIKKLKMPVLIIHGTTDIQMDTANAHKLKAVKPSARLVMISGMNHVMKDVSRDPQDNQFSYMDPGFLLNREVTPAIVSFIRDCERRKKR
jgi:pimeloyl-ACP methyl ester carboxylesterase